MINYASLVPASLLKRIVASHVWPTGYIGNLICPDVIVTEEAGAKILKANLNSFAVDAMPWKSGTAPLFRSWEGTSQTLTTMDYRPGVDIQSSAIDAAERNGISAQQFISSEVTNALNAARMDKERAILTYYGANGNWSSNKTDIGSTSHEWDDTTNAVPITNLLDTIAGQAVRPNTMVFAMNAWNALVTSTEYKALFNYTVTPGYIQDLTNIRNYFGMDRVAISGFGTMTDQYLPAPGGTLTALLDEVCILAYVPTSLQGDPMFSSQVREPVAFVNPVKSTVMKMDEGPVYDPMLKLWWMSVLYQHNPTTVNEDMAHLLYNLLT